MGKFLEVHRLGHDRIGCNRDYTWTAASRSPRKKENIF